MTEFIVKIDKYDYAIFLPYLKEEIVRCRDCRYYTHNSFPRCDLYSVSHEVEPDGFCSCAERRSE